MCGWFKQGIIVSYVSKYQCSHFIIKLRVNDNNFAHITWYFIKCKDSCST